MDNLIQQLMDKRIHEEAMAIEKVYFTKTDRTVNPKKETPFKYLAGTIPVLVSAPHAVRHIRQKKIKQSDIFTGSLACLLNQLTGCHMLAVTRLYGGDPNFDLPCLYKDQVAKICRTNKVAFVIDLHGASADKAYNVDMGTMHGKSLLTHPELTQIITATFHKAGMTNLSSNDLPAAVQNTITKYAARELGIPSVQLEINRKFRAPNQNAMAYCRLLAALVGVINQTNQHLHARK